MPFIITQISTFLFDFQKIMVGKHLYFVINAIGQQYVFTF